MEAATIDNQRRDRACRDGLPTRQAGTVGVAAPDVVQQILLQGRRYLLVLSGWVLKLAEPVGHVLAMAWTRHLPAPDAVHIVKMIGPGRDAATRGELGHAH